MNLYAQQELYLVVIIATILRRNAINCYVQNLFCEGNCIKTTVLPVMSKHAIPFSIRWKGKVSVSEILYRTFHIQTQYRFNTTCVHVKPLVVLLCFGWNGTVPYPSTGQDGFFHSSFSFHISIWLCLWAGLRKRDENTL